MGFGLYAARPRADSLGRSILALLNPPELRASLMVTIGLYLSTRRGQRDKRTRLIDSVSPPTLSDTGKHQLDVTLNLASANELGFVVLDGDTVKLTPETHKAAAKGSDGIATHLRTLILSPGLNSEPWGSQSGARDLTNALAWFLTFSASQAPARMEGHRPNAKAAQEDDFGPRQPRRDGDDEEDGGGWPISNTTRWNAFQRWACSLGFAWRTPADRLVPDPTKAIRDTLPLIFDELRTMDGQTFVKILGSHLPVLETGTYRKFVEENWKRPAPQQQSLTAATTDALKRLDAEGRLKLEDRADAPRISMSDGSTFSHASIGTTQ